MDEQMIQALAQAYMQQSGEQDQNKAMEFITQALQAAQQGDQQAASMLQQLAQMIQGGQQAAAPQVARKGAKLNTIKMLLGECPEGQELTYFKVGGKICKKCQQKKCGGEMEKHQDGGKAKTGTKAVQDFKNREKKTTSHSTGIPGDSRKFSTKEQADIARKRTLATMKKQGAKNYGDLEPGD